MNKLAPLLATLLISSLAYPEPISKGGDKENKVPGFISINPIDESDLPSISFSSEHSSSLSSYTSSSSSQIEPEGDSFYCSRYGPFIANSSNFNVAFGYKLYSIESQRIIERIRILDSTNTVVSASSKPSIEYTKGTQNCVEFTIPIKDYLNNNGLTLFFELLNSSTRTVLKRYSTTFYPLKDLTVPYSELKNAIYTTYSFGFKGNGITLENTTESFDFREMGDYLNVDNYYSLDLSNNYFKYLNTYYFTYKSATLRFNDSINQFPYLTHQSNGDISIPLSLNKDGQKVSLSFKNWIYVNRKTLEMSETYRSNCILTKKFYLPINGKSKFNHKMLYIDFTGLGDSQLSTTVPLRYDVSKSLVGLSGDGENYVVGGSD